MTSAEDKAITLNEYILNLNKLLDTLKRGKNTVISSKKDKTSVSSISKMWFDNFKSKYHGLNNDQVSIDIINTNFDKLLRYSKKDSNRNSVIILLEKTFNLVNEFSHQLDTKNFNQVGDINVLNYFTSLDEEENEYLSEAFICANNNCFKAAIVIGWCACVNKIHKSIEKKGFDVFNNATVEMKKINYGRYKRFDKTYLINSMNEIREVFDTDILWVIEYLGFIDNNQHERLRHCFVMRNNCAHPGEAGISPENLKSFFSDIANMVFNNSTFI